MAALPLINKASLTFFGKTKEIHWKNWKRLQKFIDNKTYLQTKRVCDDLERIAIGKKQKIEKIHKEPGQSNRQLSSTTVTDTEEQDRSNLQIKYAYCEKTKHGVHLMAKICSVHFVAYLIQSNIMASKLGTTLLTLDFALTQLKDILKVKCIKTIMKLVREEKIFTLTEKRRKNQKRSLFPSVRCLILASKRKNCVYQNYFFTRINWKNGCWWFKILLDEIRTCPL